VTLTVGGSNSASAPYSGSSSGSSTAFSVASLLVAAINADTSQLVNASVTGTANSATITLTARTSNGSTNFAVTVTAASTVTGFTGPSFTGTSTTLSGGSDPGTPGAASLASPITTTYLYDALSDLTQVNQLPQTRTYLYDSLGELTSAKVPEANGGVTPTNFTYTTFGEVYQRIDPRSITTTYAYDTLNRLHTITYSDITPTVTYNYGTAPASFNNGRIASFSDGSGSTTFTYNKFGRIIKNAKTFSGTNYNIQYGYNPAGEVTTLTYPSGRAVTQTYDPIGRLQTIADATNNYLTLTPATDYNSAGQLKHFAYGNGVVADFGYNDHLETTSIRYSKTGSADLLNLAYNYGTQNDGEIATITDNLDATRSMTYTYDAWSRLSTAQAGPNATPTWKYSYDYDRFGNRKNQNLLAGTTGYNTLLTIDPTTNHITGTGNTYDAAGNMTGDAAHTYTFDAENRITKVDTTAATYSYDAGGLRAKKVVGSTTTLYIYDGSSLIAEYAGGAAASSPTKEYIGGGGSALASVSSGVVTYYHEDLLSTRLESNSTGGVTRTYGHLPFGEDWYETGTTDKWKFTSYERDAESQLNYAMNRFHLARYGRFMSMDPLAGHLRAPQSLNHYSYAMNDPVNHTDPTGLDCSDNPVFEIPGEPPCGGGGGDYGPDDPGFCPPSISDCNFGGDPGYGPAYVVDGVQVSQQVANAVSNSGLGGEVVGGELDLGIKIDPNGNGDPGWGPYNTLVLYVTEGGGLAASNRAADLAQKMRQALKDCVQRIYTVMLRNFVPAAQGQDGSFVGLDSGGHLISVDTDVSLSRFWVTIRSMHLLSDPWGYTPHDNPTLNYVANDIPSGFSMVWVQIHELGHSLDLITSGKTSEADKLETCVSDTILGRHH